MDSIASAFLSGTCRMNLCRCRVVKIECQKLRVVAPCDDDYVGLRADSWSRKRVALSESHGTSWLLKLTEREGETTAILFFVFFQK